MKQKINIVTLILLNFTILSCASFNKRKFRREIVKLKKNELDKLTGKYSLNPIRRYFSLGKEKPNDKIPDSLTKNNGYYFLTNKGYKKKSKFNCSRKNEKEYFLRLNLKRKNKLRVELLENSKVIEDTTFFGKYKNGMFYIDNKFLDCKGIPFIIWSCRNNKRRIGLTKNKNLLINKAVSNEGALLVIFGSGNKYNISYEYKRK